MDITENRDQREKDLGRENTSALAIGTAKQVIERAEISPEDVDLIIVASVTQIMEHHLLPAWCKRTWYGERGCI